PDLYLWPLSRRYTDWGIGGTRRAGVLLDTGQKVRARARVLAGLILLGILAGILLHPGAAGPVVHTVALGHRVVVDVVMDAPTGRALLLAATLPATLLDSDETAVQMLDLGTGAVRRTVAVGAGRPATLALDERT